MKITHVTKCCHVETIGGTERYILELVRGLWARGISSSIGWIWNHDNVGVIEDAEGIPIYRLKTASARVDMPESEFRAIVVRAFLKSDQPDQLHFHTFGMAESEIALAAIEQGIPYVFTYHSPAWSCRREDLLRWGTEVCDGEVRSWRCSACMIQKRLRCSVPMAWGLTGLLSPLGLLGRFAGGKLHRRTAFIEDTARFRAALRTFLENATTVVACAEWSIPVLERNGAPRDRIVHCPQGVAIDFERMVFAITGSPKDNLPVVPSSKAVERDSITQDTELGTFTVGYVGRLTPVKGIHILVEAFCRIDCPFARLRICGWAPNRSTSAYASRIETLIGNDSRVMLIPKIPMVNMPQEYQKLSLLAIPSVWLETGPLTLFEAAQCGVPVYGSEQIGQQQALTQYGKVVTPNTPDAWEVALRQAFRKFATGDWHMLKGVKVRNMNDVTGDMIKVYLNQ